MTATGLRLYLRTQTPRMHGGKKILTPRLQSLTMSYGGRDSGRETGCEKGRPRNKAAQGTAAWQIAESQLETHY